MKHNGKIKFFNEHAGYGFIVPDSGGPDVFLHKEVCAKCNFIPAPDKAVSYEAEQGHKGFQAIWVGERCQPSSERTE